MRARSGRVRSAEACDSWHRTAVERQAALWIAAISSVAGGVIGALVTISFARAGAPQSPAKAEPLAVVDSNDAELGNLSRRVVALEDAVRDLARERARESATRPALAAVPSPQANPASSAPNTGAGAVVDDPLFEAAVRDIVTRVQEDRAAERGVARDTQWHARADKYANNLESRLNLNARQKAKVAEIAFSHWDTLRQRLRGDGNATPLTPEQRKEQAALARAETERKLQQVLDPRQMADYQNLNQGMKIGWLGVVRGD